MSDVTKRCKCPIITKCGHPWYMKNFIHQGTKHAPNVTRWARVTLSEEVTTRTRADEIAEVMRTQIRRGEFVAAKVAQRAVPKADPAHTLQQLIDAYDRDELSIAPVGDDVGCSAVVLATQRRDLQRLADFNGYGDRPAQALDASALVAYRVSPGLVHLKPSSWAKHRSIIDRVLRYGVRTGVLAVHPLKHGTERQTERLARGRHQPRTRRLKKDGEEGRLLYAARFGQSRYMAQLMFDLIVAALECAGRIGELLALRWFDIDLPTAPAVGTLTFRATEKGARKTRKARTVPVSALLRRILERRRINPATGDRYDGTCYVFGDLIGDRTKAPTIHNAWKRVVIRSDGKTPTLVPRGEKRAGQLTTAAEQVYRDVALHFHDLRREAASRWLERGWNLKTIQRLLGHANIAQTSTYLEMTDESAIDAMRMLDQQRATEARIDVAVGDVPSDHKPTTNENTGDASARGPRLIKGSKPRAGKALRNDD